MTPKQLQDQEDFLIDSWLVEHFQRAIALPQMSLDDSPNISEVAEFLIVCLKKTFSDPIRYAAIHFCVTSEVLIRKFCDAISIGGQSSCHFVRYFSPFCENFRLISRYHARRLSISLTYSS
jgi:hypothetical protein